MRGRGFALGLLILGLCLALPATRARAGFQIIATPTQTQSVDSTQTNWGPGTPVSPGSSSLINDPFHIQQFNSAQYSTPTQVAVLYEVVVSLKYEFDNTITMAFISPSTSTVTAQGVMHLNVNSAAGGVLIQDIVNTPNFFTQKTLAYPTDTSKPTYTQPTPSVFASTSSHGYFDASTLHTFSGTGTVSMPVYATATSSYTNSTGNGGGGSITTASAALSVTYYYYFVPEPSSMALTGLGAFGLCVITRARTRRKDSAAA